MQMKRQWLIIIILFFSILTNAQTISRFLDFHLGQSKYEVQNIVNTKYRGAEWNNDNCKIKNISLAGESFDMLTLSFQNGSLTNAIFARSYERKFIEGYNNSVRFLEYAQQQAKNMISRLYTSYVSKYGKESAQTDNMIIWRDYNGKSIRIQYNQQFFDHGTGDYLVTCIVNVVYCSISNDNF